LDQVSGAAKMSWTDQKPLCFRCTSPAKIGSADFFVFAASRPLFEGGFWSGEICFCGTETSLLTGNRRLSAAAGIFIRGLSAAGIPAIYSSGHASFLPVQQ
jgi:hypothetical protein